MGVKIDMSELKSVVLAGAKNADILGPLPLQRFLLLENAIEIRDFQLTFVPFS